ncbi:hypothetical protein GJ496_007409 [Pomphorhynchus laevis]|nr:hypothetical protein GJ496_007409 [Pomphorhynchus laevis]
MLLYLDYLQYYDMLFNVDKSHEITNIDFNMVGFSEKQTASDKDLREKAKALLIADAKSYEEYGQSGLNRSRIDKKFITQIVGRMVISNMKQANPK